MKVKTITCPNCGHANNFLAEDCSQCGINFSKYYEELEKSEALRQHIEAQEKAEALRKQHEDDVTREAETLDGRPDDESRQDKADPGETGNRADILKRQKEALDKAESSIRRKEAEAKAEKERRHREEEEKAAALRLQRQQEEEARKAEEKRAEEKRRQREEEDKAAALRLQQQQEEEARKAEEKRAEEKRRQREEEEEARAFAIEARGEDSTGIVQMSVNAPDFRPADTLQIRLSPYAGQMIGITYGNPSEIRNVKLISVDSDHFQVFYPISKNVVSYPYRQLVQITENAEGISAVGPDISPVFPVVVEVPRPFFYKS